MLWDFNWERSRCKRIGPSGHKWFSIQIAVLRSKSHKASSSQRSRKSRVKILMIMGTHGNCYPQPGQTNKLRQRSFKPFDCRHRSEATLRKHNLWCWAECVTKCLKRELWTALSTARLYRDWQHFMVVNSCKCVTLQVKERHCSAIRRMLCWLTCPMDHGYQPVLLHSWYSNQMVNLLSSVSQRRAPSRITSVKTSLVQHASPIVKAFSVL